MGNIIYSLREKLNNSYIGQKINNTKLGQFVESASEKYAPRLSDIVQLPFDLGGGILFVMGVGSGAIGQLIAPTDPETPEESDRAETMEIFALPFYGGFFAAALAGGVVSGIGNLVSSPLVYVENRVFGERNKDNIFNYTLID